MATYLPLEYWVLIPKGIGIVVSLVLAVKILRLQHYILNRLYAAAFLLWGAYLLTISIIYVTAAESAVAFVVANILHVTGVVCCLFFIYLLWVAVLIILRSTQDLGQWPAIGGVATAGLAVLAVFTEPLVIVDATTGTPLHTVAEWNAAPAVLVTVPISISSILLFIFATGVYLYAILALTRLAVRRVADSHLRRRMFYQIAGFVLLLAGWAFFLVIQSLALVTILTGTLGHLIWSAGLIFLWLAQNRRGTPTSQEQCRPSKNE